ncbi:DUF6000 family protein [Chryseobacterium nepalense]|jgi:hypothetical protein|uniref:DUF6000 family protein n=1 Tax=Chryseobacterium nepalense TaxID=1854498 RepID=A0ABY4K8W2_9FLAO|nr:DUF6000 family protein [Chryseobacterium nepalense]UPQ77237.1 DUF6000 family protein [Chryseobacterium nepalense]
MNNEFQEELNLHSAGAIIRHASVFNQLESHQNNFQLSKEFTDKWVLPLYMKIRNTHDLSWVDYLLELKNELTEDVTLALLGDFNWRTRTVGAYLSVLKNYESQIPIIGVHLLKSEVCYAGDLYALVLAYHNTPETIEYLHQYLEYYLQKPELDFDQQAVLEAVAYLDIINKTNNLSKYLKLWNKMLIEQGEISKVRNIQIAKIIEQQEGKGSSEKYLKSLDQVIINPELSVKHITEQIKFLQELKPYFD